MSAGRQKTLSTPAYRRIAEAIARRIESGNLMPGDAVPSERDLAVAYEVSLMTARHALQALTHEGILRRRPNIGTFVAPPKIHFNKLTSFTEEMLSRGRVAQSRVLTAAILYHEEEVSAKLALPMGGKLIRLQRLRLSGDEPFAVESCDMSESRFPGILEEAWDRRSLFEVLTNLYGIMIHHADEEIDATSADSRTANLLNIKAGAAILRVRQLLYDAVEPIIYSVSLYKSDRFSVAVQRFR